MNKLFPNLVLDIRSSRSFTKVPIKLTNVKLSTRSTRRPLNINLNKSVAQNTNVLANGINFNWGLFGIGLGVAGGAWILSQSRVDAQENDLDTDLLQFEKIMASILEEEEKDKNEIDKKNNRLPLQLIVELKALFGDRCDVSEGIREAHGKDFSFHKGMSPDLVVYPLTTEEVASVISTCSKYKVPIIPYGSGTSLEGHITAVHGGVCVSFLKMKNIISVNVADMDCVVQPGVTYEDLNLHLKQYGLFFPPDPGPGASIGGMVGTSCSGPSAVRYGTMKDNVVNLTVVLPNGKIVKTAQRAKKSSAGYDLTHLFVGAEGTLGIVTEITVKLRQIPEVKSVAICHFNSIEDASNSVIETIQKGVQIGKVELLDDVMMKAVNENSGLTYKETPTLFFEFSGSKVEVEEQLRVVKGITKAFKGSDLQFAYSQEERDELWKARKVALWASTVLMPGAEIKITDVCVPISRLADCIKETKEDINASFLPAPLVGHVGDGNFHLFILFNPENPNHVKEVKRLDNRLIERAIRMGGTCTGEHGIGVGKKEYLQLELGDNAIDLMKTIKKAIDPDNIMNPGKVLP